MGTADTEFKRRNTEIVEFLAHLQTIEIQTGLPPSLLNTMKASAVLMLYNQVESTMTNILQEVFDHFEAHAVDFDDLNDKMKSVVLSYAKSHKPSTLVGAMSSLTKTLVVASFDRTTLFSGNVDARRIRDTLADYGVIFGAKKYSGDALLRIKAERNNLAHGNVSFADSGKTFSMKDIQDLHEKTSKVLANALTDFSLFISNRNYA
ncbi:MAE_28990/MAE_18760 family HEPN-like nuclease [Rhizobacter fulvus]